MEVGVESRLKEKKKKKEDHLDSFTTTPIDSTITALGTENYVCVFGQPSFKRRH